MVNVICSLNVLRYVPGWIIKLYEQIDGYFFIQSNVKITREEYDKLPFDFFVKRYCFIMLIKLIFYLIFGD